jgi:hypothetical protein
VIRATWTHAASEADTEDKAKHFLQEEISQVMWTISCMKFHAEVEKEPSLAAIQRTIAQIFLAISRKKNKGSFQQCQQVP